jgi:RNA polymerase sigma-70 factor, ECF subfamily
MMPTQNLKLSFDDLVQAIRIGVMPDGSAVQSDAHLDALAEALDALGHKEIDALMEATGGGVANAEATAHRLSKGATRSGKSVEEARLTSASGSRPNVREAMVEALASLRAFAISLCGNVDRADELVQESLLRAWANMESFQPGTNMSAWLFTILRNLFRSEYRKRRREVEDVDGSYAETLTSLPEQSSRLEIVEFKDALKLLPSEERESLILVGASGFSYEEAAQICGCAVGTIESRVNRACGRLAEILAIDSASDFCPQEKARAVSIKPSR